MSNKNFNIMPGGNSTREKKYTLFRECTAIIAKRVKENPRCHKCFTHGFIPGGVWTVNHGCDGCAEMDEFLMRAESLFKSENEGGDDTNDGKGVRHG